MGRDGGAQVVSKHISNGISLAARLTFHSLHYCLFALSTQVERFGELNSCESRNFVLFSKTLFKASHVSHCTR